MPLPGEALAILAAILFGTAYVATGVAVAELSPVAVGAWRGLSSAALLGIMVGAGMFGLRLREVRPGGWVRFLVISSLGGPMFLLGMNYSVAWSGAATSAFVAGLYAVFAAALAPALLGERLDRRTIIGLVAGLIGAAALAQAPADRPAAGVAAALGAAFAFACYLVLSRRWAERYGLAPSLIAGGNLTLTGLVLLGLSLSLDPAPLIPEDVTSETVRALAWLAVASVIAQLALMVAVRRTVQRSTSAMLLFNPPTAAFLAWLLLHEPFPPLKIAASVLVFVGILVVAVARHPPPSVSRPLADSS